MSISWIVYTFTRAGPVTLASASDSSSMSDIQPATYLTKVGFSATMSECLGQLNSLTVIGIGPKSDLFFLLIQLNFKRATLKY